MKNGLLNQASIPCEVKLLDSIQGVQQLGIIDAQGACICLFIGESQVNRYNAETLCNMINAFRSSSNHK